MFKHCIQELKYMSSSVPESPIPPSPIIVYDANVVKADFAVTLEIKRELQDTMEEFESKIPERLRDWHPFSDNKVLDLVHPSLFPLVYGTTRILEHGTTTLADCTMRSGEGKVLPVPPYSDGIEFEQNTTYRIPSRWDWERYVGSSPKFLSRRFQWLPCEVDISNKECRLVDFIWSFDTHDLLLNQTQ